MRTKHTILGLMLGSALALQAAGALAAGMMPVASAPISLAPAGGSLGTLSSAPRSNFTFIPADSSAPDAPAPLFSNDPERQGFGEYGDDNASPAPASLEAPLPEGQYVSEVPNPPVYNPAAPPSAMPDRMMPGNTLVKSATAARPIPGPGYLSDGQSFAGVIATPQQAGFYTLVAASQQEFAELWRTHIGQEPPPAQLQPGQSAVFASAGPRGYNGYNVSLEVLSRSAQKVQVLAGEISPSSAIALSQFDNCPWQVLIVRTDGAKVEVLHRKTLAGNTVN